MRNTGILLFLVGIYLVINSGSFRDLVMGKAELGFLNPKNAAGAKTRAKQEAKENDESGSGQLIGGNWYG